MKGKQVTVGTAATKLADMGSSDVEVFEVQVANRGSASVFLGDGTVTASGGAAGFELKTTDPPLLVRLREGETLWAACASATQRVDVLYPSE